MVGDLTGDSDQRFAAHPKEGELEINCHGNCDEDDEDLDEDFDDEEEYHISYPSYESKQNYPGSKILTRIIIAKY